MDVHLSEHRLREIKRRAIVLPLGNDDVSISGSSRGAQGDDDVKAESSRLEM